MELAERSSNRKQSAMINIKDKKDCCGCWACKNACPKQCIEMVEDEEGFCYPQIDKTVCIDCGLCEKVCPAKNPINLMPFEQKAFVVQNRDEQILRESTSGGFFTAIGEWMLEQGGVVFGVRMNDKKEAEHVFVEKKVDLKGFRNSKYVQSKIGTVFVQVRDFLKSGRKVLFSGTPCQVEGLLLFLKKRYDNLYTVDVVCRAVPSPLVLRKYISMQQGRLGILKDVKFRDKYHGYKYSSMSLFTERGVDYHEGIDTDVYLRSFFCGVNIRPSCTECFFRSRYRRTDFTIWDCFNISDFCKKMDNDKGATRVICQSERSVEILCWLERSLKIVEVDSEKALKGVKEMVLSPSFHKKRSAFFADLNNPSMTTEEVFEKYFPVTLRHRAEKMARLWSNRLGIYMIAKKVFKALHRGEVSR